jgi:hypothetical protein
MVSPNSRIHGYHTTGGSLNLNSTTTTTILFRILILISNFQQHLLPKPRIKMPTAMEAAKQIRAKFEAAEKVLAAQAQAQQVAAEQEDTNKQHPDSDAIRSTLEGFWREKGVDSLLAEQMQQVQDVHESIKAQDQKLDTLQTTLQQIVGKLSNTAKSDIPQLPQQSSQTPKTDFSTQKVSNTEAAVTVTTASTAASVDLQQLGTVLTALGEVEKEQKRFGGATAAEIEKINGKIGKLETVISFMERSMLAEIGVVATEELVTGSLMPLIQDGFEDLRSRFPASVDGSDLFGEDSFINNDNDKTPTEKRTRSRMSGRTDTSHQIKRIREMETAMEAEEDSFDNSQNLGTDTDLLSAPQSPSKRPLTHRSGEESDGEDKVSSVVVGEQPEISSTQTVLPQPNQSVQMWTTIGIGPGSFTSKSSVSKLLLESSLPTNVIDLIRQQDRARVANRADNAKLNVGDRPSVCWLSQYFGTQWATDKGAPENGRSTKQQEKLKTWWVGEWVDASKECPQCEHRKAEGEVGVVCFYFTDPRSIRCFM